MAIRVRGDTLISETTIATATSEVVALDGIDGYAMQVTYTDTTPAAKTFDSDRYEIQTLTYANKAGTGHQDFIVVQDAAGLTYAVALTKPVAEIQTLTFPDKATANNGDYIVVENTIGTQFAVALTKPVAEVQTLTYPAVGDTDDGDFVIVETTAGVKYALAADTTGAAAVTPAGPLWTAANHKALVDISGAADAAAVAALMELGWNALTGFTAAITTDDTAADGTMTLTQVIKAPVVNPVPKNFDESTAGNILGVQTTGGVAAQTPTGALWVAATHKGLADISGDTTAAQVAARAETAFNLLTGFTASVTSDDSAANGTMTLTQGLKAPVDNPVPKSFDDATAGTITGVQSTGGVASDAPSGPIWTAVAGARKGLADISGDTTAAQVAARAETAWNLLTGFTAAITSNDTAADGTMTFTQTAFGPVVNPVPKNAAESGAGSIAGVETVAGLTSEVSEGAANAVSITSHGMATGLKGQLTSTGTLPAGLALATDYYIIVVDANTVQFATSLADAVAGTAVDITDEGSGVHTFTSTSLAGVIVKLQASNDGTNYEDLSGSTVTISAAGTKIWNHPEPFYRYVKVVHTPAAGAIGLTVVLNAKADH